MFGNGLAGHVKLDCRRNYVITHPHGNCLDQRFRIRTRRWECCFFLISTITHDSDYTRLLIVTIALVARQER